MSDSNLTKQALANSLKALMEEKPFEKITITDIVKRCNLNRLTFYYHFKDKYDLMNWIYYTETAQIMMQNRTFDEWADCLCALCYYMQENKNFYLNALNTTGQNSFPEYLLQYIRDISMALVEGRLNKEKVDEKETLFIIEFFSQAIMGLIKQWAQDNMQLDPRNYVNIIKAIIEASMQHELFR
ncbi:MAG: dihydroxyacetone kinase transcriptional activator DhaS [Peptococcia bacterium]